MTNPTAQEFRNGFKETVKMVRKWENAKKNIPSIVHILERLVKWEKGGDEHDMDFILAETHAILADINKKGK